MRKWKQRKRALRTSLSTGEGPLILNSCECCCPHTRRHEFVVVEVMESYDNEDEQLSCADYSPHSCVNDTLICCPRTRRHDFVVVEVIEFYDNEDEVQITHPSFTQVMLPMHTQAWLCGGGGD